MTNRTGARCGALMLALALTVLASPAPAQDKANPHADHMKAMQETHRKAGAAPSDTHAGHSPSTAIDTPATAAFKAANAAMHQGMDIPFSGDADVDFVKGMIPHHQGAVDMAKIVLAFGKDPELRQLAQEIVGAQEKEIAFMKAWLAKKGQK